MGQYVAARTGQRAFLAHWAQTVDYFGKRDAVAAFFNTNTPVSQRSELLKRFQIRYVLYGNEERSIGAYNPGEDSQFVLVFITPSIVVYEIVAAS